MGITNLRMRLGGFFWDDRVKELEEMVLMPIQDPIEMGLGLDTLVERLEASEPYRHLFERAFGDSRIDAKRIGRALAQFVRSGQIVPMTAVLAGRCGINQAGDQRTNPRGLIAAATAKIHETNLVSWKRAGKPGGFDRPGGGP